MFRKTVSSVMLVLLITSMLVLSVKMQPLKAGGVGASIYLNADGSITPPTAPIYTADNNTYTLTGNITADADGIVIERDNIVLNGAGCTVTGSGASSSSGITLTRRSNVTVRNIAIRNFDYGIYLNSSSNNALIDNNITGINNEPVATSEAGILVQSSYGNTFSGNTVMANGYGIFLERSSPGNTLSGNNVADNWYGVFFWYSSGNTLSDNNVTANRFYGIAIGSSSNNTLSGNNFANGSHGIELSDASGNTFSGNTVMANSWAIFLDSPSSNNFIYHNSFVNNTNQVARDPYAESSANVWDNGYPSGGNYWSDYNGTDQYNGPRQNINGSDGMGDTPYIIDANNTDRYPLMSYWKSISVQSEFSGYFLENLPFNNTFGVYTGLFYPIEVYGILDGINYTFKNPTETSGSYNLTVNMGSLNPNSTLNVFAVYPDGTLLNETYPIEIIETPSWLMSILNTVHAIRVEREMGGDWNNSYAVYIEKEFDLGRFNVSIPLPKYAGGGNYTLLPSIEVDFAFYSNGTFTVSAPFTLTAPEMEFGVASVEAHVTISVSGEFDLQNNTIEWLSATFSLDVGVNCRVQVPIWGYTFDLPIVGETTIGISATVTVDADFAVSIVLAPTQSASQEFISGLELMIQSITGQMSFDVGLAINGGIGIVSLSGGGSVNFLIYLKAVEPYISGGVVTGTLFMKWHALWWGGTIWSMSGRLYEWGSDPYMNPGSDSNFTITPRYYNTTDYEGFEWIKGYGNATAIQNVYPFTRISAASSGDSVYLLYSSDNMSMSQESGLCLTGLQFNSNQRTLQSLVMPSIANEILFDPVVISLPNGTLLGMWDSAPFSEVSNATSPFEIENIILQYSYFDTHTGSWGPIGNLTETGVASSYMLSSDSTGSYALVLEGDSIFSTSQYLVEYNVESSAEILNMSAANVSNIISFDSFSHIAVLQMMDGSYELIDLSSQEMIAVPSMSGYDITNVQLAMNSTDSLGILYSNSNSSVFLIYNISFNTTSFSMNVSQSTSRLTLIQTGSKYQLVTCDSSGLTSYLIENQTEGSIFYPIQNITSMGVVITDIGTLVYTTENYGNCSYPLLNLTLTYTRSLPGDLNGDFKVSLSDLILLANAYGSKLGDTKWNPNADINGDFKVSLQDLVILANHYGQHYP